MPRKKKQEPQAAPEEMQQPMEGENEIPQDGPGVPPSEIHFIFDGPGSAMIKAVRTEGIVATNQLALAGLILLSQAIQDWGIPLTQQIIASTVGQAVEEMRKPKIETAGGRFFNPNMLKGGGGRPA